MSQESSYEFNKAENYTLGQISKWMGVSAAVILLGSGIRIGVELLGAMRGLMLAVYGVNVALAGVVIWGSISFGRAANTKGHDIEHTMRAMAALRWFFALQAAALFGAIAAGILSETL